MNWRKILASLDKTEFCAILPSLYLSAIPRGEITSKLKESIIYNYDPNDCPDKAFLLKLFHKYSDKLEWNTIFPTPESIDINPEKALKKIFASTKQSRKDDIDIVDPCSSGRSLFSHQLTVIRRLESYRKSGKRAAMVHLPTGVGKTRTAIRFVVNTLLSQDKPSAVIWLASRSELLEQASEEFNEAWKVSGDRNVASIRYYGNADIDASQASKNDTIILFASFQKLRAKCHAGPDNFFGIFEKNILCVVDEAHQSTAPSYLEVIECCKNWNPRECFLLGLSATPGRTWSDISKDEKVASLYEGNKITLTLPNENNPVQALISMGYLSRPKYFRIDFNSKDVDDHVQQHIDLQSEEEYSTNIYDALGAYIERNKEIADLVYNALESRSRAIVFMPTILSCKIVSLLLAIKSIQSYVVTGSTGNNERRYAYNNFSTSSSRKIVLLNHSVLTAGFDAPKTDCVIIARPTKSLVSYSQMVGRGLRGPLAGGTETCDVYTLVDLQLPGFSSVVDAFMNWEDVWSKPRTL